MSPGRPVFCRALSVSVKDLYKCMDRLGLGDEVAHLLDNGVLVLMCVSFTGQSRLAARNCPR